jgi:hypothetical protein
MLNLMQSAHALLEGGAEGFLPFLWQRDGKSYAMPEKGMGVALKGGLEVD